MVGEAIILAGGLGTRLRSILPDVPKTMAPIHGKPFLAYLLHYLARFNLKRVILCVGYKAQAVRDYFGDRYQSLPIVYSIEDEPLGTGGAIRKGIGLLADPNFPFILVMNGDTFFPIDLKRFSQFHEEHGGDISVALAALRNFDRYGCVKIDSQNRIIGFQEKKYTPEGLVNGGIYLVQVDFLRQPIFPTKFSFEKDLLEKYFSEHQFLGVPFSEYFIDIGVPEDYRKAQSDFQEQGF